MKPLFLLACFAFGRNLTFSNEQIESFGQLSWNQFSKIYNKIDLNFERKLDEHFRVLKRDCYNYGLCKKYKTNSQGSDWGGIHLFLLFSVVEIICNMLKIFKYGLKILWIILNQCAIQNRWCGERFCMTIFAG